MVSLLLTLFAAGLIVRSSNSGDLIYDPETGEIIDEDDDEAGVVLGALTHWYYLFRAQMRRRQGGQHATARVRGGEMHAGPREKPGMLARARKLWAELVSPPDDGLENFTPAGRREPGFGAPAHHSDPDPHFDMDDPGAGEDDDPDYLRAPDMAPGYGEEIYDDEEEEAFEPAPRPAASQHGRAQAGARAADEAEIAARQPRRARSAGSLIGSGIFELPSLHLLAEAKAVGRDATLSTEALEQNARLLEGVLEDFGVRARSSMSAPARSSRSTSSSRRPASSRRASSALPTTSPAR